MSTDHDPAAPGAGTPAPGAPAGAGQPGGTSVTINSMSGGSVATGEHGRAESTNVTVQGLDQAHQELLAAVAELRRQLAEAQAAGSEGADSGLLAQLTEVQGEITAHGQAPRPLLARLLAGLAAYGPAAGAAASAVATVIQALAPLLG
ncbi:hypothetical protein [Streptomyces sp. TS71-3]|uniref:hypothetical protein n=1 Tax=Streptomyces sp. TS71-3 TaxID=2733862 RepID=UPI001B2BAB27|nr:hypothetical protein [Streptomyces sp. TS71-3]GHJ35099.1 hypothetical protein Sm713_07080 [Streptomyces sp. TS71-3]